MIVGGQWVDLSLYGVFPEPYPEAETATGARFTPAVSINFGPLTPVTPAYGPAGSRVLVFADDPEDIPSTGLLYRDTLQAGPVRVFAYGVNATGDPAKGGAGAAPLTLGVAVLAGSQQVTVGVERLGTGAGPSNGPYTYSARAALRWLATSYAGGSSTVSQVTVGPGAIVEIGSVTILPIPQVSGVSNGYPGYVGNIIADFVLSAPATVLVYAREAGVVVPPPSIIPTTNPLAPQHSPPGRGTFPNAEWSVVATLEPEQYLLLPVQAAMPLRGTSAVDGGAAVTNAGFGTLWRTSLQVNRPPRSLLPAPPYALVALGPGTRYGVETGVYWVQGNMATVEDVYAPPPLARDIFAGAAVSLGTVPLGQSASVEWLATGGIGLPVGLFALTPLTHGIQIGEALGAAGVVAAAGLAGYLARGSRQAG